MVPQVDFDIVERILQVLEGWELGNRVCIGNTRHIIIKNSKCILVPGIQKNDFYDFSKNFTRKNPEYGNLE